MVKLILGLEMLWPKLLQQITLETCFKQFNIMNPSTFFKHQLVCFVIHANLNLACECVIFCAEDDSNAVQTFVGLLGTYFCDSN